MENAIEVVSCNFHLSSSPSSHLYFHLKEVIYTEPESLCFENSLLLPLQILQVWHEKKMEKQRN